MFVRIAHTYLWWRWKLWRRRRRKNGRECKFCQLHCRRWEVAWTAGRRSFLPSLSEVYKSVSWMFTCSLVASRFVYYEVVVQKIAQLSLRVLLVLRFDGRLKPLLRIVVVVVVALSCVYFFSRRAVDATIIFVREWLLWTKRGGAAAGLRGHFWKKK